VGRDFIDADFLEFSNKIFSGNQTKEQQHKLIREKLASLDHVNLRNYLYINNRDLTFRDESATSGVDEPSMSNGAAYADLDNDGDLDLIVNNINREAFVFINNTNKRGGPAGGSHFINLRLEGSAANKRGIGVKVLIYSGALVQMQEQFPVRGYFSTVDYDLHFGLGTANTVDSIVVIWPDNKIQSIKQPPTDSLLTVSWQHAKLSAGFSHHPTDVVFHESSDIPYKHHDNLFNDFASQRLLPQKYSQLGPFITTGDVNKDGLIDFFIGGGFNFSGNIAIQSANGQFQITQLIDSIKMEEDEDCVFFDADNDGDPDLLVTSGDTRYEENAPYYKPRLYINDANGKFSLKREAIPDSIRIIAGTVSAADYDGDGYTDIFIGGRVSKNYPIAPRSFLLKNNKGVFTDVTATVCPALQQAGMVTASAFVNIKGDTTPELIIAGEWMKVRFFSYRNGIFSEFTDSTGLSTMNGMWRSLTAADIDNDGDVDLIVGNQGLNSQYKVSNEHPMELHAADIDGNGSIDPIPFYYFKTADGRRASFPAINRGLFAEQVPAIKKQFLYHRDYAKATFDDIFNEKVKKQLLSHRCDETRSCWLENTGNGKFIKHPLPTPAQFAPVNAIVCEDFDHDGYTDLLIAGNEYHSEVMMGRYDASYGLFLKGTASKEFTPVSPVRSGFIVRGDVRDMSVIRMPDGLRKILVAVNNDSLKVFDVR
jgi:hypothetical protein